MNLKLNLNKWTADGTESYGRILVNQNLFIHKQKNFFIDCEKLLLKKLTLKQRKVWKKLIVKFAEKETARLITRNKNSETRQHLRYVELK